MSLEASMKVQMKPHKLEPIKTQQDPRRLIAKKGTELKPMKATKLKEKSPESSPKASSRHLQSKVYPGLESSTHTRNDRIHKIKEVIKEFSGSLERQHHPKSQFEEENRNRSYLPRRFDAREMNIKIPRVKQKIKENESYLQQIDTQIAALEQETASKVIPKQTRSCMKSEALSRLRRLLRSKEASGVQDQLSRKT